MSDAPSASTRLSGEDLSFWWVDSPMQPTTMAMLMLLDRVPDPQRLHLAFGRAVAAVPRLAQRVIDAPLDLTLPRWELDPTFDLEYHVRRHALARQRNLDELFHEIGPAYETPFDRSRPLWEARVFDGLHGDAKAALFFKLHHAVADGVGGNAIFAAMTDGERDPPQPPPVPDPHVAKGAWPQQKPFGQRLLEALRDRIELDVERAGAVAGTVVDAIQHPEKLRRALQAARSIVESARFDSHSPLKRFGRARRLSGCDLPFEEVRRIKKTLDGSMIDVILTIMARGIGKWHAAHGLRRVRELMTLVPVNLRKPEEWADKANVGNVATGILVPLPIHHRNPLVAYREIHKRMVEKKADPASAVSPVLAEILSVLPRQFITWMAEATFGNIDFIVTNVPGILVPRFLAGAEILSAYPFAPVAVRSPVSVALYGYRDRLFIGLNSDETTMPDVAAFKDMIHASFTELRDATGV
jgi:diacylglycerol O-acyltransferase